MADRNLAKMIYELSKKDNGAEELQSLFRQHVQCVSTKQKLPVKVVLKNLVTKWMLDSAPEFIRTRLLLEKVPGAVVEFSYEGDPKYGSQVYKRDWGRNELVESDLGIVYAISEESKKLIDAIYELGLSFRFYENHRIPPRVAVQVGWDHWSHI